MDSAQNSHLEVKQTERRAKNKEDGKQLAHVSRCQMEKQKYSLIGSRFKVPGATGGKS